MTKLTPEALDSAFEYVKDRLWAGEQLSEALLRSAAEDNDIREDVLAERFYARYPNGLIEARPLSSIEADELETERAAQRVLSEYGRWAKVDGRKVLLDGVIHTLVTETPRKSIVAFRHRDRRIVDIPHTRFKQMTISAPKSASRDAG